MNASKDDIKKAYRKLAHLHHPDKGGNATKFSEITQAYSELMKEPEYVDKKFHSIFEDEFANNVDFYFQRAQNFWKDSSYGQQSDFMSQVHKKQQEQETAREAMQQQILRSQIIASIRLMKNVSTIHLNGKTYYSF